jgi:hypothetical protein
MAAAHGVDCGAALEQALQSLGMPYEKADGSIWIYGYRYLVSPENA